MYTHTHIYIYTDRSELPCSLARTGNDAISDLAFYHLCMMDLSQINCAVSINQHSFLVDFLNWKDSTRCFNKHEGSIEYIQYISSITIIFFINPFIYTVYTCIYNK